MAILNYRDHGRDSPKTELAAVGGWRENICKHGEIRVTRIFQGHFLPVKFGFEKRGAHLSCQIRAGQISREQALELLEQSLWSPGELETETDFVCRKLGFTRAEWNSIVAQPPRSHFEYPTNPLFSNYSNPAYR